MSNKYPGGFIQKTEPTVTRSSASGVWTLSQVADYIRWQIWPGGPGSTAVVVNTYTGSGSWVCPAGVTEVEYLVVAGGGGGGYYNLGGGNGGGGAGGFRTGTGLSVTAGTTYTVTVGSGGVAGTGPSSSLMNL